MKKKEENRLKVKDFHIPEDKTELDELWKKSGEININDLRPIYLKSGSKVTEKQYVGLRAIWPRLENCEKFIKRKAKYGLDATWQEARSIVGNDNDINKYFKVIREGKSIYKETLLRSDKDYPGSFAHVYRCQEQ